jgi:Ca2+-binding RTX toxin-like protein
MTLRRTALPALITLTTIALGAGTAHAGTLAVSVSGAELEITGDGTGNRIDMRLEAGRYVIHHNGPIDATGGCHVYDPNFPLTPADAVCPSAGITLVSADLSGGDDDLALYPSVAVPVTLEGGPGDDELESGPGTGGRAYNVLRGGEGRDTLIGRTGVDVLDGGPGGDDLVGGVGRDRVDYASRSAPLTISIDGAADDGEAGEGDLVDSTVEEVVGGGGNDHLTGSPAVDRLLGGPGDDTLDGLAGGDTLVGGPDDDVHNGGDGSDTFVAGAAGDGKDDYDGGAGTFDEVTYAARATAVTVDLDGIDDDGGSGERDNVRDDVEWIAGGAANDWLIGSNAANLLTGGGGNDFLSGHGGNDTLLMGGANDVANGGDGNDALNGGPGADFLFGAAGDDSLNAIDGAGANDDLVGAGNRDSCQSDLGDRETDCEW